MGTLLLDQPCFVFPHLIVTKSSAYIVSCLYFRNNFQQAYSAQVQLVLEPVFARLGVKHEARNIANGGLGTLHNGLAAASIYGPDISFLLWDSSMTEKGKFPAEEIFARQAILGGIKVPVVWGLEPPVLKMLHGLDVDIGYLGSNSAGLTLVENFEDLETVPWAARYLKCSNALDKAFCKSQKYDTTCWINRTDFTPTTDQRDIPSGRAGWHPGQSEHKLTGRNIAFTILRALHEVLTTWSEAEGQVLPESAWHVSSDYENTRSKVKALAPNDSLCKKYEELGLLFFCKFPFKVRKTAREPIYPSRGIISTLALLSPLIRRGRNLHLVRMPLTPICVRSWHRRCYPTSTQSPKMFTTHQRYSIQNCIHQTEKLTSSTYWKVGHLSSLSWLLPIWTFTVKISRSSLHRYLLGREFT
jgi:hypothetical protein